MTFSLVIPSYRGAKRLALLLETAITEFVDTEIIVCDDGSPTADQAEVRAVVAHYASRAWRTGIVELPENRGPYAAQRAGVEASRGEVVFLMDDDITIPHGLREAAEQIFSLPRVGVVSWRSEGKNPGQSREARPGFLQSATQLASYCMAFKRSLWDELGGLDPRFRYYCADSDFALRAALAGYPCYRAWWPLVPHAEHQATLENPALGAARQGEADGLAFQAKWGASGAEMERRALAKLEEV